MAAMNHHDFFDEIPTVTENVWGPGFAGPDEATEPILIPANQRGVLDVDGLYGEVYSVPLILTHVLNRPGLYEDPLTLSSFWRAAIIVRGATAFTDVTDESAISAAIMMHTMTPFMENAYRMTLVDSDVIIRQAAASLLANHNQCTSVAALDGFSPTVDRNGTKRNGSGKQTGTVLNRKNGTG